MWDVDRCFRQQLGTCAPALSGQELEWIVALDSVPELLATPDLLAAEGTVAWSNYCQSLRIVAEIEGKARCGISARCLPGLCLSACLPVPACEFRFFL